MAFARYMTWCLVLCVIAAVIAGCGGGPKRQLRMNLTPGSEYQLTIRNEGFVTAASAGKPDQRMDSTSEWRLLLRAAQVYDDGDVLVSATIENAIPSVLFSRLGPALKGATFSMRMSPRGKIKAMIGMDEMREQVRKRLHIPKAEKAMGLPTSSEDYLLRNISDGELRGFIEQVTYVWPEVPVSVGDSWGRDPVVREMTDTVLQTEFTLRTWDSALVTVSHSSTIGSRASGNGGKLSGSEKGEIRIAPVEGIMRSYRATGKLEGEVIMPDGSPNTIVSEYTVYADFVAR